MAGVQRDEKGPFIQFTGPDKVRRKLRLTGFADRKAERYAEKINALNRHAKYGMPLDDDLSSWIRSLQDKDGSIATKLVEYGLLPRQNPASRIVIPTLGAFLTAYINGRSDVKGATNNNYRQTERNLLAFFDADRLIDTITAGDADEFRLWQLRPTVKGEADKLKSGEGLADNTVRRRCSIAGQFFQAAVRKGLIKSNPFEGVGGVVRSNKERMYFVTATEAVKVLEACPDNETRLFFALSRYGGLRTPSEHNRLRWDDVDWARNKFLVHSPKTERHIGGESRWVPIFPELRPYLQKAWDEAPDGAEFVLSKYRNQVNLRTRFRKIIKRAGLTVWEKLFQNLRSTRQTELAAVYPLHKVCSWLGNKAAIAQEHYLQVTDADYDFAATKTTAAAVVQSGAVVEGGAEVAHSRIVSDAPECETPVNAEVNEPVSAGVAIADHAREMGMVVRDGVEPSPATYQIAMLPLQHRTTTPSIKSGRSDSNRLARAPKARGAPYPLHPDLKVKSQNAKLRTKMF